MSLDTLRTLFVIRGHKAVAWVMGFAQSLIFVLAITSVFRDLGNVLNMLGYGGGFATGCVVGMLIEGKIAVGHKHLRVVSPRRGAAIAQKLRDAGYAVTEIPARGKDGMVSMLTCDVLRKNTSLVERIIREVDPEAFITEEDVRPTWRGFWRA
ncbi:MAG: DUF5698 domain-containing protein [Chloroflexota bacterium]